MIEYSFLPLKWEDNKLLLIDQRVIPMSEEYVTVDSLEEGHNAIKVMVTRGAPLIGFTAIFTMAVWAKNNKDKTITDLEKAGEYLKTARPTAVNLMYETDRCVEIGKKYFAENNNFNGLMDILVTFGNEQMKQLESDTLSMAKFALDDLKERVGDRPLRLLTICNTGILACGVLGTALGVLEYAHREGKLEHAYACETRPYLQGARLTSFEMSKTGMPHEIVVEGAASYLMKHGLVDAIFAGADRVVANGDSANKIGTSTLSIVAKYYNIPFYIVAPTSTFDMSLSSGDQIEIEMRPEEEILNYRSEQIAPKGSRAKNPSFDVSEHMNITGVICEKGLISPVNTENVSKVVNS